MTLKSLAFGICLLGNFKWPVKVTLHFHYIYSIANYKHRQCLSSSSYNYSLRTVIQAWRLKAGLTQAKLCYGADAQPTRFGIL